MEISKCQIGENLRNYVDRKKRCFYLGFMERIKQDPELSLQSGLLYQTMLFNGGRIL